jgi:protein-S-isoprenylcysteine O-methyltransferase Ste14
MNNGLMIFAITLTVWISFEVLLVALDAGKTFKGNNKSSFLLLVVSAASLLISAMLSDIANGFVGKGCEFQLMLGSGIIWGGMVLRLWALYSLGGLFSTRIKVEDNHKIITTGPYRFIRHPAYLGALVTFIGVSVALGNIIGIAVTVILMSSGYYHRICAEENVLLSFLGEKYARYMQSTKRLIPLIY